MFANSWGFVGDLWYTVILWILNLVDAYIFDLGQIPYIGGPFE